MNQKSVIETTFLTGYVGSLLANIEATYTGLKVIQKEPIYQARATNEMRRCLTITTNKLGAIRLELNKAFPKAFNEIKERFLEDEVSLQANSIMSVIFHLDKEDRDKVEDLIHKYVNELKKAK